MDMRLGTVEAKFADIIWDNEPLRSREIAAISGKELGWQKTTSHTVLKRLCDKGIFKNEKGMVTSLISREEFYAQQGEKMVEESFEGSLPAFIAAFSKGKKVSKKELAELRAMVEEYDKK